MKKYFSMIVCYLVAVAGFSSLALAQESQQKALELLNPFVEALLIPDATTSATNSTTDTPSNSDPNT